MKTNIVASSPLGQLSGESTEKNKLYVYQTGVITCKTEFIKDVSWRILKR